LESYSADEITEKDEKIAKDIWQQLHHVGIVMLNDFLPKDQAEEVGLFHWVRYTSSN